MYNKTNKNIKAVLDTKYIKNNQKLKTDSERNKNENSKENSKENKNQNTKENSKGFANRFREA